MKICKNCGTEKDPSEFNNQSRSKDGKKSFCRICDKELNKARYLRLEKHIVKQVKEWQKKNPEKVKAAKDKYRNKQVQTI